MKENLIKQELETALTNISNQTVLVIGDTIIDKYTFVKPKGRAVKDPILSVEFVSEETYAGGVLAVAKHISSFVKKVILVSVIGNEPDILNFINEDLPSNVEFLHFTRKDAPTTIKKRYIDSYRKNKLFKIEHIDDKPIAHDVETEIIKDLKEKIPNADLVVVADFGHGLMTKNIKRMIEQESKFLSINVQSNSSNMGYNYATLYNNPDFIVMNEIEVRLPLMMRFEPIEEVMKKFAEQNNLDKFLVTLGSNGSIHYDNGTIYRAAALAKNLVDTVGAGDASFAISSLFVHQNTTPDLIPFIANCAASINVQYMGNKDFVTKQNLVNALVNLNGLE